MAINSNRTFLFLIGGVIFIFFCAFAVASIMPALPFAVTFAKSIVSALAQTVIIFPLLYLLLKKYRKTENMISLYSNIVEESREAVCITDDNVNIKYVNAAFTAATGYAKEEVIGKNPKVMKSGRHGAEFYKEMWNSLRNTGQWQGEVWDRRKDGEIYPKWLTIKTLRNDRGRPEKYIGIFSDITTFKQTEEYIEHLTHYDHLTNLPNRILLRERLKQAMSLADRQNHLMALMFIDMDQFNKINGALGYSAGDECLTESAQRLLNCVSPKDTVTRAGGDEFIIVLNELGGKQDAVLAAQRIIDALAAPFILKKYHDVYITVSIGVTLYPSNADSVDTLLRYADTALKRAKELGNNKFQFYDPEMGDKSFEYLSMETNLRHAFQNKEFVLHYQPVTNLQNGRVVGMEALIRRQEHDFLAMPASFIKIAEKTDLILSICEWTLITSCRQAMLWQKEGLPALRLSVNVSAAQFHQQRLIKTVEEALRETGLDPKCLELELTERVIIYDTQASIKTMHELKEMGVGLSIDDFGTGYSSLSYLKKFPIDKLKIDISFVRDIPSDPDSVSIAKAIIALAHNLDLRVIVEGVENERQYLFFKEHGCDEIQGYYFSVPLPAESFKKYVLSSRIVTALNPDTIP